MSKQRLEAFTDGVIAIIITIMVLEMKVPEGSDFAALRSGLPVFLAYALSFANVGIFWNNHHHMLHVTERINGMVLWANLFLLFWMSLMPFVIRWMDETQFAPMPLRPTASCWPWPRSRTFCWSDRSSRATAQPQSWLVRSAVI